MQSQVCGNLNVYCMNNGHNLRLTAHHQFGDRGDEAALMWPPSGGRRMSQSRKPRSRCLICVNPYPSPPSLHHCPKLQSAVSCLRLLAGLKDNLIQKYPLHPGFRLCGNKLFDCFSWKLVPARPSLVVWCRARVEYGIKEKKKSLIPMWPTNAESA